MWAGPQDLNLARLEVRRVDLRDLRRRATFTTTTRHVAHTVQKRVEWRTIGGAGRDGQEGCGWGVGRGGWGAHRRQGR
jgi:hypothetical protein